jgi:hypothetical protein
MIPRLSTNLYATVSTPEQWVVGFNAAHGAVLGRDLTIDEILDTESNTLLGYLLSGDIDPSMFHQANLRAYAGSHTLLTDLLDRVLDKYARLRVLPVVSLTMGDIARRMQDRAALDQAGVTATVGPGQSITVRAAQAVRVPITGALASDAEHYGGVAISRIEVPAGGTITVPLAPRGGASAGSGPGDNGPSGSVKVAASAGGTNDGGCALAPSIRPWAPGRGSCCAWLAAALIVAASRPRRDRTQPRRRPGRAR